MLKITLPPSQPLVGKKATTGPVPSVKGTKHSPKKTTKTGATPSTIVTPIQSLRKKYIFVSEWLDKSKDSYEMAIGEITFENGKIKEDIKSYTIKQFSKNINDHQQHKAIARSIEKNGNFFVAHRENKSYFPYSPYSGSPLKKWVIEERRKRNKSNDKIEKEFKEIMFSYEKKYEIKSSCKDHVDEVFKCAYVEVKFLMDFFKYANEY